MSHVSGLLTQWSSNIFPARCSVFLLEARFETRMKQVCNLYWVESEKVPLRIGGHMRLHVLNRVSSGVEATRSEANVWL